MEYRYLCTSANGFVQQLTTYVMRGYPFYVLGKVSEKRTAEEHDRGIITRYDLAVTHAAKRKRLLIHGSKKLQYLRYREFWVLLASDEGRDDRLFANEEVRDARRRPIVFRGYSIGLTKTGRLRVQIARKKYERMRRAFRHVAHWQNAPFWERKFRGLFFEPYAPVRRQVFRLLKLVNEVREPRGWRRIGYEHLRLRRRIYRPFE